ncbi:MAG: hypothetical protein GY870_07065, partial [archaeon]|nr:hypothetical protein [archaeon]
YFENVQKYVTLKGNSERKYYVTFKNGKFILDLSSRELNLDDLIMDICDVDNLNTLTFLNELNLSNNGISEIKCLDNLVNLKILDLSRNRIREIKGLKNLINLERIDLRFNQISEIKSLEIFNKSLDLFLEKNPILEKKNSSIQTDRTILDAIPKSIKSFEKRFDKYLEERDEKEQKIIKLKISIRKLIQYHNNLSIHKLARALKKSEKFTENLIYELVGEGSLDGTLEGDNFKFTNDPDEIIRVLADRMKIFI